MKVDFANPGAAPVLRRSLPDTRWGVASETGRLTDVLLCAPDALEPVPCCSVTAASLRSGFSASASEARRQHCRLRASLIAENVNIHMVPALPGLPDLAFARDTGLMTPWGYLQLAPAAEHRRAEAAHVAARVTELGIPILGRIEQGTVEGGDVCIARPGLLVIGCSGERTTETGAASLAHIFRREGWQTVICRFDPHFLHLDTMFCMLTPTLALAAVDVLDDMFLATIEAQGIDLIPVTYKEVQKLGCNVVSLGESMGRWRVLSTAANLRINAELTRRGFKVIAPDLDQFTNCGGGPHCLTLPLKREE